MPAGATYRVSGRRSPRSRQAMSGKMVMVSRWRSGALAGIDSERSVRSGAMLSLPNHDRHHAGWSTARFSPAHLHCAAEF